LTHPPTNQPTTQALALDRASAHIRGMVQRLGIRAQVLLARRQLNEASAALQQVRLPAAADNHSLALP
jgi:hypothetical protein